VFQDVASFTEAATDITFIAGLLAALAVIATVITLAYPVLTRGQLHQRMKSVASSRDEMRRRSRANLTKEHDNRLRHDTKENVRGFVERLQLQKLLEDPTVQEKLLQAGMRGPGPLMMFYLFRFSLPVVFFVAALFFLFFVNDMGMEPQMRFASAMGACMFGFYGPNLYVSNIGQKRQKSIMRAFPDALDLLLICVESGMSIEAAFNRVGAEIGSSSVELAEELSLTTAELAYLQDRRMAFENLGKRTNHPGVRSVATALIQAERYGTPLGSALRVMSKENREMRMMEAEKKAASLPAQLTVPMILFFLPVLFIVILTPAYISFQKMDEKGGNKG